MRGNVGVRAVAGVQWGTFVSNADGVHLTHGEFTLCGDAFDMPDTEASEAHLKFKSTTSQTVTCHRCIDIIDLCAGVHTRRK